MFGCVGGRGACEGGCVVTLCGAREASAASAVRERPSCARARVAAPPSLQRRKRDCAPSEPNPLPPASPPQRKPIKHIPGPEGVRGRNSDNELILEKLGWQPTVSLRDGLRMTYSWIKGQIEKEVEVRLAPGVLGVGCFRDIRV